ncbi:class I SAM-dependent methyltransferase [Streptomyces sp. Ru87]|uniref:class I SAM-dependent methyltransferase n=1 Tax=Streptomyces sp. Ru87 TaxID=2044307 RepID=UPI00211D6B1B|nr:class I SAM-dependent methyltransferase [Streptomyces sp. Ru87]
MTTTERTRYAPEWLALREGADATARAGALLEPLRRQLTAGAAGPAQEDMVLVIRDLGCGTGSMGRWLAPRLPGPQHWVLHDHDPGLLLRAVAGIPCAAEDGSRVTVATERGDVGRLTADALAGTSLVTASALLDLLTREELDTLAAACAGAGCPALLALSVTGRVELGPADPMDAEIAAAFNAHQRRVENGRQLLGPDAVGAASVAFARHGLIVTAHASPWRLGPDDDGPVSPDNPDGPDGPDGPVSDGLEGNAPESHGPEGNAPERHGPEGNGPGSEGSGSDGPESEGPGSDGLELAAEWLRGWVGAAAEQRPELADRAEAYLRNRLAQCEAGTLRVVVHHSDVLALPVPVPGGAARSGDRAARGAAAGARGGSAGGVS